MAWFAGAQLHLIPADLRWPAPVLHKFLYEHAITTITLSPAVLAVLSSDGLSDLQTVISAADELSAHIVERWSVGRHLFNAYGPTESTVCTTISVCTDGSRKPTIGYPLANTQVYLLDDSLQPVPIGIPAQMYIGGVGLARGYLNRPELTAEKFVPNPFSAEPGARLYKTGDIARYLPDGSIDYLGRIDRMVKVRGFRIELSEIESTLREHPAVREAIALAHEDQAGYKKLVAYLVLEHQNQLSSHQLREYLQENIPDYMIPSIFVFLDAFPLTVNGKIDHRALPQAAQLSDTTKETFVAPRNTIEEMLSTIWSQVLEIERISMDDNFFDLGGHSLLATRMFVQIHDFFQVDLSLRDLFEAPTIVSFARIITEKQAQKADDELLDQILAELEQLSDEEARRDLKSNS